MTHVFLKETLSDFEVCARHAVERVLALPTMAPRDFKVESSMTNMSSLCCIIECWNGEFSLTLSVGINKTDLGSLIPGVESEEIALDALGEVANCIAGQVMGISGFEDHFGRMAMSPPLFSNGGVTSKKACAIHGVLVAKAARLFLGFAIAAIEKEGI
jgi:CheY-specific phosphatase CheX